MRGAEQGSAAGAEAVPAAPEDTAAAGTGNAALLCSARAAVCVQRGYSS